PRPTPNPNAPTPKPRWKPPPWKPPPPKCPPPPKLPRAEAIFGANKPTAAIAAMARKVLRNIIVPPDQITTLKEHERSWIKTLPARRTLQISQLRRDQLSDNALHFRRPTIWNSNPNR